MLVSLIAIGNSKGIRIPKTVIDALEIEDSLELRIKDKSIILEPIKSKPRQGWEEAFAREYEDDDVLEDVLFVADDNSEDFEWEW